MTTTNYQAWRRTPGGRVHSMLYPSEGEAIGEIQRTISPEAVREVQDRHELAYGRRPSVTEARAAIEHGWERGQQLTGTAGEIQSATQRAFPGQFVIRHTGEVLDDSVRTGADLVHPVTSAAVRLPPGAGAL